MGKHHRNRNRRFSKQVKKCMMKFDYFSSDYRLVAPCGKKMKQVHGQKRPMKN